MSDWIDDFMTATARLSVVSETNFRLWAGIGIIAAALERHVWTHTDVDPLYPNLYTILCGGPASGKSVMIAEARKLLAPIDKLNLGPDSPTRESFLDSLEKSHKTAENGSGMKLFCAMTVLCREFGVLIPTYSDAFLATLSDLFDNPPIHTEPRRTSKDTTLENPTVNILGAATPDAIGKFPEAAWGEGFTSRVVFVYGVKPDVERDILKRRPGTSLESLQKQLREFFTDLHGEFEWELPAQDAINKWVNKDKQAPVPTYERLLYYNGRRTALALKLSMISAVSAGHGLTVTLSDFNRAKTWLFDVEKVMPDVFRAMHAKSDALLLRDCHRHFYSLYVVAPPDKRRPTEENAIWAWLEDKTTSDKIPGLMNQLEKSGRFRQGKFKHQWVPNALDQSSTEPEVPT